MRVWSDSRPKAGIRDARTVIWGPGTASLLLFSSLRENGEAEGVHPSYDIRVTTQMAPKVRRRPSANPTGAKACRVTKAEPFDQEQAPTDQPP